jgi:hypothetical protein
MSRRSLAPLAAIPLLAIFVAAPLFAGCDTLFPEFAGSPPPDLSATDAGSTDAGSTTPHLAGSICALADVRDYRSCGVGPGAGFRVTVEETRDVTTADATGHFTLVTATPLAAATVAVVDPSGAFATTITVIHPLNGIADPIVLPVLSSTVRDQLFLAAGVANDPGRGALLTWILDAKAAPIPHITAARVPSSTGPFTDGPTTNELSPTASTGPHGLIALFDLPPPTATLALSPPPTSFILPIRPNTLTLTTLILTTP